MLMAPLFLRFFFFIFLFRAMPNPSPKECVEVGRKRRHTCLRNKLHNLQIRCRDLKHHVVDLVLRPECFERACLHKRQTCRLHLANHNLQNVETCRSKLAHLLRSAGPWQLNSEDADHLPAGTQILERLAVQLFKAFRGIHSSHRLWKKETYSKSN